MHRANKKPIQASEYSPKRDFTSLKTFCKSRYLKKYPEGITLEYPPNKIGGQYKQLNKQPRSGLHYFKIDLKQLFE